jgi:hypothetical protein
VRLKVVVVSCVRRMLPMFNKKRGVSLLEIGNVDSHTHTLRNPGYGRNEDARFAAITRVVWVVCVGV